MRLPLYLSAVQRGAGRETASLTQRRLPIIRSSIRKRLMKSR